MIPIAGGSFGAGAALASSLISGGLPAGVVGGASGVAFLAGATFGSLGSTLVFAGAAGEVEIGGAVASGAALLIGSAGFTARISICAGGGAASPGLAGAGAASRVGVGPDGAGVACKDVAGLFGVVACAV